MIRAEKKSDKILIVIPEGKKLLEGVFDSQGNFLRSEEVDAPNWSILIDDSDNEGLLEYLTREQITDIRLYGSLDKSGEPVAPTNPTLNELKIIYELEVERIIDNQAKKLGYNSIYTAATYIGYESPWKDEALRLCQWRDSVWIAAFELLNSVISGGNLPPLSELPSLLPIYQGA